MKLFCYFAYIFVHFILVSPLRYFANKPPRDVKGCTYQGYIPGGRVKITKIEAPVAKLANDATAAILGHLDDASGLAYETLNIAREAARVFQKTSPHLGPVIGIFGAVSGIVSGKLSPSASDILDAANEAIAKLTNDMNDKLSDLKGYVDNSIIRSEKSTISNYYRHKFNLLIDCLSSPTKELSNECQRDSVKDIVSSLHEFAVFDTVLFKSSHRFTTKEVKKLEAFLVPFRNYADLVILGLVSLIETYKDDTSREGPGWYKKYSLQLKQKAEFFIKYSKAAVKAILDGHDAVRSCKNSYELGKIKEIWEGAKWFKVHTSNEGSGKCVIDPFTNQRCEMTGYIRADGKTPGGWHLWFIKDHGALKDFYHPTPKEAVTDFLKAKLANDGKKSFAEIYASKEKPVIQAYWQKQLLDSIPNWEKAIKIAEPGTKVELAADVKISDDYSPRYKYRKLFVKMYPNFH